MDKIIFHNNDGVIQGGYYYTANDYLSARAIIPANSGGKVIMGILKGSSTHAVSQLEFSLIYTKD